MPSPEARRDVQRAALSPLGNPGSLAETRAA
jgi:hypothetical protein